MQVNKFTPQTGLKKMPVGVLTLLVVSLLLAACGDNTATAVQTSAAATSAAATTLAATTPSATTAPAATTAAVTTASATTASATTASTTAASTTTAAATTAPVTTASSATTPAATSASSGTTSGTAKITLQNTTALIGSTINVTGEGFPANTWLTIQLGPNDTTRQVASLALSDAAGKFATPLILSTYGDGSKITPGKNTILVATQDGKVSTTTTLTLNAPATTATPTH